MTGTRPLRIFVVTGEVSGDHLGAAMIHALRARLGDNVSFAGVGGERMAAEGVESLFPLEDIAVMGVSAVIPRLRTIIRRIRQTADAAIAANPDVLVIIDSPDFTHRVAKRVRARRPDIPIVDYVSPSVWAWRPGRAKAMRAYVDHLLALLPFEPEAHRRLGGPPCTYIGHPLIARLGDLRPGPGERPPLEQGRPTLLVLPGSRRSEISRLLEPFGATLGELKARGIEFNAVVPAVSRLADEISARTAEWPVRPQIVLGEAAKLAAFRSAHAALAASGTATLELALAGVPMVVAYRVSRFEFQLRHLIKVPSIVLPNLILGENAIPELLQHESTPGALADQLAPLLADTEIRHRQLKALHRLDEKMSIGEGTPSEHAADVVIAMAGRETAA